MPTQENKLPVPGNRSGLAFETVATSGFTFNADRDFSVVEIRLFISAGTIDVETIRIEAEGQSLFNNQSVPMVMLMTAVATNTQAPGANNIVIFRPEVPILWNRSFPIKVTPSATTSVMLIGVSLQN